MHRVTVEGKLLGRKGRAGWVLATAGVAIVAACVAAASKPEAIAGVQPSEPHRGAASEGSRDWAVRNGRGKAFAARGEPAQALAEFNQAISYYPGHAVLYANRGGAKLQQGDREGAIADCSRAVEMDRGCVEGYLNRAQARKEIGDWAGAADDYAKALEILHLSDTLREAVSVRLEEARRRVRWD